MAEFKTIAGLYYTREHDWLSSTANSFRVGISDYAQDALGDIVYLDIPLEVEATIQKGDTMGFLESVKAVEDLHSPINGTVKAINFEVKENPSEINKDPYASWLWEIEIDPGKEEASLSDFMDEIAYKKYVHGLTSD